MRQYKGYYIDHVIFNSKEDIDIFLKNQAVEAFKRACRYFAQTHSLEASMYEDEKAEVLHNSFGFDWETIEQMEIEAYQTV